MNFLGRSFGPPLPTMIWIELGMGDMDGEWVTWVGVGNMAYFFEMGGKVQKWREGNISFTNNVKISLVNVFVQ